jgi:hypothetical protein
MKSKARSFVHGKAAGGMMRRKEYLYNPPEGMSDSTVMAFRDGNFYESVNGCGVIVASL